MSIILRLFFRYGADKRDDDACLLEVDNWKNRYPPTTDPGELQIRKMVSKLESFSNPERVEDAIADHFNNIVRRSRSELRLEVRRFLIHALADASLDPSLTSRLQTVVERSLLY